MKTTAIDAANTTNILEAARINGAKRVHLASTVWVYNGAPDDVEANEEVPFYCVARGCKERAHVVGQRLLAFD